MFQIFAYVCGGDLVFYFYFVVFSVGVLYTLVSLIISGISGAFHGGGDIGSGVDGHFGHDGHIDLGNTHSDVGDTGYIHQVGHGDISTHGSDLHAEHAQGNTAGGHGILSKFTILLNPLVAVSFLTVFGGLGIMGVKFTEWSSIIVFAGSLAAGIALSVTLYNFVAKPIYRSENSSDVSREKLIGIPAEVTTDILENGYGTIMYTVNSIKYTGPAKHIDDKLVKQGQRVVICKIENNTFFVSELSEILN